VLKRNKVLGNMMLKTVLPLPQTSLRSSLQVSSNPLIFCVILCLLNLQEYLTKIAVTSEQGERWLIFTSAVSKTSSARNWAKLCPCWRAEEF